MRLVGGLPLEGILDVLDKLGYLRDEWELESPLSSPAEWGTMVDFSPVGLLQPL